MVIFFLVIYILMAVFIYSLCRAAGKDERFRGNKDK